MGSSELRNGSEPSTPLYCRLGKGRERKSQNRKIFPDNLGQEEFLCCFYLYLSQLNTPKLAHKLTQVCATSVLTGTA